MHPLSPAIEGANRPPICAAAPLAWFIIPLAAGIALVKLMGAFALLTVFMIVPAAQAFRRRAITYMAASGLVLGVLLFLNAHTSPQDLFKSLPPRETTLHLRIDELFNARKPDRVAGVASIVKTDIPCDLVTGYRTAFYLDSSALGMAHISLGEILSCRGVLTYLPQIMVPDDYQMYLLGRDIYLTLNYGEFLQSLHPPTPLEAIRRRAFTKCQSVLATGSSSPGHAGNVLASMLLGNRSLLTDERIDLYRKTGTYHLFAVSGLHVGSVALCIHLLAGLFRLPLLWRLIPILSLTWIYIWLTGSSPSAVRAGIMITTLMLSRHLLRQSHLFPSLILSAGIVLVLNPFQLFHLGFQLSYGVVASIILIGLPMAQQFRQWMNSRFACTFPLSRFKRWSHLFLMSTVDLLLVSFSASLASMPLIIQHFNLFTPGGMVLGIVLNPLVTVVVMAGAICLLICWLPFPLAGILAMGTWPMLWAIEFLLKGCLTIPGAVSNRSWPLPSTGIFLLLAGLFAGWIVQRLRQEGLLQQPIALFIPPTILLAGLTLSTSVLDFPA